MLILKPGENGAGTAVTPAPTTGNNNQQDQAGATGGTPAKPDTTAGQDTAKPGNTDASQTPGNNQQGQDTTQAGASKPDASTPNTNAEAKPTPGTQGSTNRSKQSSWRWYYSNACPENNTQAGQGATGTPAQGTEAKPGMTKTQVLVNKLVRLLKVLKLNR